MCIVLGLKVLSGSIAETGRKVVFKLVKTFTFLLHVSSKQLHILTSYHAYVYRIEKEQTLWFCVFGDDGPFYTT